MKTEIARSHEDGMTRKLYTVNWTAKKCVCRLLVVSSSVLVNPFGAGPIRPGRPIQHRDRFSTFFKLVGGT